MKIQIKKINNHQHKLKITRTDGSTESVTCETRSLLIHDLTHFAVESEAGLKTGFWGLLASGKTLDELNDRSGESLQNERSEIMDIEKIVAVLQGLTKGQSAEMLFDAIHHQVASLEWSLPSWFDLDLIHRVDQRLKGLLGHWKATPFGESMEISWENQQTEA